MARVVQFHCACTRARVRELACDELNEKHTTRKHVQLCRVCWRFCKCLWRHVAIGSRAVGGSEARVCSQQLGHSKVSHLGSTVADHQDVVAAEVSVQHLVTVEVGESLRHVVGNVDLDVERERRRVGRSLQEAGQAFVHQFHEQDGQPGLRVSTRAQVLDDVAVPQAAQKLDFLLEVLHDAVGCGVPGLEEDGVQYFSCADELVALGSVHRSIGAYPERVLLCLDETDVTEPEAALLRH